LTQGKPKTVEIAGRSEVHYPSPRLYAAAL
jgi:hypothetical protein